MGLFTKINEFLGDLANRQNQDSDVKSFMELLDDTTKDVLTTLSGVDHKVEETLPDNVISFIGAAGGVGTTTLISNVTYMLRKLGKSVIVIDSNLLYPSVQNHLGYKTFNDKHDLVTFLSGSSQLSECIYHDKARGSVLSAKNKNIMDCVHVDNDKVHNTIIETIKELRKLFDVILIDTSLYQINSDVTNLLLYLTDKIYMVWDENANCIQNTEIIKTTMKLCGINHESKLEKIIFNKRTDLYYPKDIFDKLGLRLGVVLPYEAGVVESAFYRHIYIEKGIAHSKYASYFCKGIGEIVKMVLEDCGSTEYIDKEQEEDTEEDSRLDIDKEEEESTEGGNE